MHYNRRTFLTAAATTIPGLTLADFASAAELDPFVAAFEDYRAKRIAYSAVPDDAACNAAWDAMDAMSKIAPQSIKGIGLAARAVLFSLSEELMLDVPADLLELQPCHFSGGSGCTAEMSGAALLWGMIHAAEALTFKGETA